MKGALLHQLLPALSQYSPAWLFTHNQSQGIIACQLPPLSLCGLCRNQQAGGWGPSMPFSCSGSTCCWFTWFPPYQFHWAPNTTGCCWSTVSLAHCPCKLSLNTCLLFLPTCRKLAGMTWWGEKHYTDSNRDPVYGVYVCVLYMDCDWNLFRVILSQLEIPGGGPCA